MSCGGKAGGSVAIGAGAAGASGTEGPVAQAPSPKARAANSKAIGRRRLDERLIGAPRQREKRLCGANALSASGVSLLAASPGRRPQRPPDRPRALRLTLPPQGHISRPEATGTLNRRVLKACEIDDFCITPVEEAMAKTKFRPLHDRVVVRRIEADNKTKGGIIIPDTAQEKPSQGEVVSVGPGGRDEAGKLIPIDVKAGDKVLFGKWSGTEVKLDGEDFLIMKESDIMCVIA